MSLQNAMTRHCMVAETTLRVITFLLHFTSALFLLYVSLKCSGIMTTKTYTETVTDPNGYAIVMNTTCGENPFSRDCFYGLPQAYDVVQHSLGWNVFALLAAFEWLSASFALYYLGDLLQHWWVNPDVVVKSACLVWNVTGIFLLMPYNIPITMLQAGITSLSLLAASAAQITAGLPDQSMESDQPQCNNHSYDVKKNATQKKKLNLYHRRIPVHDPGQCPVDILDPIPWVVPTPAQMNNRLPVVVPNVKQATSIHRVTQHYTEYCTSASLLYVAVLILFVPDPVSWAPIFGFTGIMICNIAGIGAHNSKIDNDDSETTQWYDLDWTKCGNHFKLFILHSWLALTSSIFIIIYLSRDSLTSSDVPAWVRFILWNLLVTYTLFGVWATFCYGMAGERKHDKITFDSWMSRLDYGLTILSAAAKLPVAYTVFYGLVQEPGGTVCSLK